MYLLGEHFLLGEYDGTEILGFFNNFDEVREHLNDWFDYEIGDERELVFEKAKFGGKREVYIYDFQPHGSRCLFVVEL